MKKQIQNQLIACTENLAKAVGSKFQGVSDKRQYEMIEVILGSLHMESHKVIKKACEDNNFEAYKANLQQLFKDCEPMNRYLGVYEEHKALVDLVNSSEQALEVHWEFNNNGQYGYKLDQSVPTMQQIRDDVINRLNAA